MQRLKLFKIAADTNTISFKYLEVKEELKVNSIDVSSSDNLDILNYSRFKDGFVVKKAGEAIDGDNIFVAKPDRVRTYEVITSSSNEQTVVNKKYTDTAVQSAKDYADTAVQGAKDYADTAIEEAVKDISTGDGRLVPATPTGRDGTPNVLSWSGNTQGYSSNNGYFPINSNGNFSNNYNGYGVWISDTFMNNTVLKDLDLTSTDLTPSENLSSSTADFQAYTHITDEPVTKVEYKKWWLEFILE